MSYAEDYLAGVMTELEKILGAKSSMGEDVLEAAQSVVAQVKQLTADLAQARAERDAANMTVTGMTIQLRDRDRELATHRADLDAHLTRTRTSLHQQLARYRSALDEIATGTCLGEFVGYSARKVARVALTGTDPADPEAVAAAWVERGEER